MSIFVRQSALICAIGATKEERLRALVLDPPQPEKLSFCFNNEGISIPYHLIRSPSPNQKERLYPLIDQLMTEFLPAIGLTDKALERTALLFGSSSYDLGQTLANFQPEIKPVTDQLTPLATISDYIKNKYHFKGLSYSYNSACSSSANALTHARLLLENNIVENAVVIGCELYNPATVGGFYALQLLSPTACRPFDNPDGMVLGEAIGAVLLSKEKSDKFADLASLELLSAYSMTDTENMTGADEAGSGLAAVMDACSTALSREVSAIKTCGVGTVNSDKAELSGIQGLYDKRVPLLAFKPYVGNTLGASGVVELVLLKELMESDILPKSVIRSGVGLDSLRNKTVLLNNFGFGGNNVCMLVKHHAA